MGKERGERIAILSPCRIRGRVRSVELVHPALHADLSSVPRKGGMCRSSETVSANHKRGKFLDVWEEIMVACLFADLWIPLYDVLVRAWNMFIHIHTYI